MYMLRRSLGIEPAADLNSLTNTYTMAADRAGFHVRQTSPVQDVHSAGNTAELNGIHHHQPFFTFEFFEKIYSSQTKVTESRAGGQTTQFQFLVNGLADTVIGDEIVTDADNQST